MSKRLSMIVGFVVCSVLFLSRYERGEAALAGGGAPFFLPHDDSARVSETAVDAAGGVHVAYKSLYDVNGITPVYYAYCSANCDQVANWSSVVVGDARLGSAPALAVTATGQPRLVWTYRTTTLGDDHYVYAACDSNCLTAANWSEVELLTSSTSRRNLTLTPQGQPRFLYVDFDSLHKGLFYAYCDANCTVGGNWSEVKLSTAVQFYDINFMADDSGVLHLLYNFDNGTVEYGRCGASCGTAVNWSSLPLYNIGVNADISLALTDQNQPRLAVYTGAIDHKAYYGWCDSDCVADVGNWSNWSVGLAEFEGEQLDLALDGQNQPHLVYHSQSLALGYAACTSDCESSGSVWQNQLIETAVDLNATEPAPPGCTLSSWNVGELPSVALDGQDQLYVSYDAIQGLGGCTDVARVRLATVGVEAQFSLYLPLVMGN